MSVVRGEAVQGAAAPALLSSGSVGPMADRARLSVLAEATSQVFAHGQPGSPTVHPLRTPAA